MANCKSTKKRILTNEKSRLRNVAKKSKLKTLVKKLQKEISEKADSKEATLKETICYIDKMSTKGIIHKNSAARKKSKLTIACKAS